MDLLVDAACRMLQGRGCCIFSAPEVITYRLAGFDKHCTELVGMHMSAVIKYTEGSSCYKTVLGLLVKYMQFYYGGI